MKVTIAYNNEKNGIELFFTGEFPETLASFLRELGFKESLGNKKKWYVDKHPAYVNYATSLREVFTKGGDWRTIKVAPSFSASEENIDNNKFSVVTFNYQGKDKAEKVSFVVFDSYKKVVTHIATEFANQKFGDDFKHVEVFPRNHKRKARFLLKENQVIYGTGSLGSQQAKTKSSVKEQEALDLEFKEEVAASEEKMVSQQETTTIQVTLNEVISELLQLEEKVTGESETIIGTTLFDLEDALEQTEVIEKEKLVGVAIENFRNWAHDLDDDVKNSSITSMNKLILSKGGELIPFQEKEVSPDVKSISKDIFSRDHIVQNVLVPVAAKEPFQSGSLTIGDSNFLKLKFKQFYTINDENIKEVSPVALFQLAQMAHPKDYGIAVNRSSVLSAWEVRGLEAFEALGYPTDLDYPYVNIHTGYKSVSRLGDELYYNGRIENAKWWAVVEHARPIADLAKGIVIIDEKLLELVDKRLEFINSKTDKPKIDKKSKEALSEIEWDISRYERSKLVIQEYLNKDQEPEDLPEEKAPKEKKQKKEPSDYLDKVIAVMHDAYANSKRFTKKKIEALKETTNAPNMGALWEAVELSWLLWYKQLYKEPIPFERRLKKMDFFWQQVQPTYGYSDSSKEIYKQYSTPCPIGAIIAEYTGMGQAEFIFEPSAGNGLLVMGANPRRTHVNEIDNSRKRSLEHQGFGRITTDNAAEPFPEIMTKVHDVVVTNPPFAKWEADAFDKERIIQKYFHKHRGLAHHIRLEHLMTGLALHTMVDDGKAAIILMGHVYFGEDGLFAKYRPFYNWLYRHYHVDDIINMNSYKLYNKQGAVAKTMLILIGGRKTTPSGVAPSKSEAPHLDTMVETFYDLWEEVKLHTKPHINTLIEQLKTAQTK